VKECNIHYLSMDIIILMSGKQAVTKNILAFAHAFIRPVLTLLQAFDLPKKISCSKMFLIKAALVLPMSALCTI
jgi:hypothetical protein